MTKAKEEAAKTAPPKKRRRSASTTPKSRATKSRAAKPKTPKSATKTVKAATPTTTPIKAPSVPPTKTLIIDNGGDTLKYGWSDVDKPELLRNITARLLHQLTVLVGDELSQVNNPNSLHSHTRSTERGMICNLSNQTQVWKRMLNKLGVSYNLNSEAAKALGWTVGIKRKKAAKGVADVDGISQHQQQLPEQTLVPAESIAVLLLLPPHCPRILLDQILYIWLEDFGVSHVGFGISQLYAAKEHPMFKTSVCVDLGWSATQIVPTFKRKLVNPLCTRRIPIGGRHMVNMMKYYMTYRQYNLMDQEFILSDVLERLGYISLEYNQELAIARKFASGQRPYDRDYILPDYQNTHEGQIKIPAALERRLAAEQKLGGADNADNDDDEDDEDDDDYNGGGDDQDDDHDDDEEENYGEDTKDAANVEDEMENSDEEESEEQMRRRVMRQRAEEERQRREVEVEQQILRVSVERFTVPEVLFRPLDAGLTPDLVGLATAIHRSIQACPKCYHAPLYRSVCLTGGLSLLKNMRERLERELRPLVPSEFELKVETMDAPITSAWEGARRWVESSQYTEWSISKDEWELASRRQAYSRLLVGNGGSYA